MNTILDKLNQALKAQQAGDMRACETHVRDVLSMDPRQPDALHFLGMIEWQKGQPEEGERLIRQSLAVHPSQPAACSNLGNLLASLEKYDEAIGFYKKAIQQVPNFTDAHYNLGLTLNDAGRYEEALNTLNNLEEKVGQSAKTLTAKGVALAGLGHRKEALHAYEAALAIAPDHGPALHNKAVLLRQMEKPEEALPLIQKAVLTEGQKPQLHYNLGNILYDLDRVEEAIEAYEQAIAINPLYRDAHTTLNKLHFQHDHKDHYLQSYNKVLSKQPEASELAIDYSKALILKGKGKEAAEVCLAALHHGDGNNPDLVHESARALYSAGETQKSFDAFEKAITMKPNKPRYRQDFARCLIIAGAYDAALAQMDAALPHAPYDQETLAYQALCWRLTGDSRYQKLYDFERFVQVYDIPVPDGYGDIEAFNKDLVETLTSLHKTKVHPAEQTLRGGTQTKDSLFDRQNDIIQKVKTSISECVQAYIDAMPEDNSHPLLSRKCKAFDYAGSWSVRLRRSGFHVNHIHSEGWISSCYYVSLPSVVETSKGQQGWIKFGESNMDLGDREEVGRIVQPKAGRLVLFPSYMFHGTVPFEDDEPRLTIAFDAVPVSE